MDKRAVVLDIAMNLNRVGNWAADDFGKKRKRIRTFLSQTTNYISTLDKNSFDQKFAKTFDKFLLDYIKLEKEAKKGPVDTLSWAETAMTWGNILTHRSKLI